MSEVLKAPPSSQTSKHSKNMQSMSLINPGAREAPGLYIDKIQRKIKLPLIIIITSIFRKGTIFIFLSCLL